MDVTYRPLSRKSGATYYTGLIKDWHSYLEYAKNDFNNKMIGKKLATVVQANDFYFIKTLGTGAFGRVMLVQKKSSGEHYATKILRKKYIVEGKQVKHALNEKNILQSIRFPFTVHLEYFFHDAVYLYFVLPLVEGGEMFMILHQHGKFDESLARFYAAQVLLALEYLHYINLVHRDLKPENILMDRHGFIKVTDFGFCKRVEKRTYTFCGTPEYMAPEILLSKGYGKSVDYWALGVLIYEFNCGRTPFYSRIQARIYDNIVEGKYQNQPHFSSELRDIIRHLLQSDLTRRYGILNRGVEDIKDHKWFNRIIWIDLINKKVRPPIVPAHSDIVQSAFFEKFREEPPLIHTANDVYSKEFMDF